MLRRGGAAAALGGGAGASVVRRCRGRAERTGSWRCRSIRPWRRRSCRSRPTGSGCCPTTGRRASRWASTRWSSCGRSSPRPVLSSHDLSLAPDRAQVAVAGMVVARQRPSTANGVVFMLLEDELGQMNLIVPPQVYERFRPVVRARSSSWRGAGSSGRGATRTSSFGRSRPWRRSPGGSPTSTELGGSLPPAHHFGHR